MEISIIDTHAHLDMNTFNKDREEVIKRAVAAGVGTIICVGTNLASSRKCIKLAEEHEEIVAAVGIHPHEASTVKKSDINELAKMAGHRRVVALGEMGLDFYRNYAPRGAQLETLQWQLELAVKTRLPVIIHSRQAEKETLDVLKRWTTWYRNPHGERRGVIHCFSGDNNTAREYLDMGFYLALGAYIGYPSSASAFNVIRGIPADRLMVETDCPFLPPQDYRRKRNEPSMITYTVEALASIREVSFETIARETTQNAHRLFRMPGEMLR
jgi:TatD DNase family protein